MMRDTSVDAEGLLEELGVTARRERQAFSAILKARRPLTRGEVARLLGVGPHQVSRPVNNLVKRRILAERRRRRCSVSGFQAWELSLNPWQRQLRLDLDAQAPAP
jgi:predicted transcriptional regulator